MKKFMFIGAMMLCGMMLFSNNASAQKWKDKAKANEGRVEYNNMMKDVKSSEEALEGFDDRDWCVDDENYFAAKGYGSSQQQGTAQDLALRDAIRNLTNRLEGQVKSLVSEMSTGTNFEQSSNETASLDRSSLDKLNSGFQKIVNQTISALEECRVIYKKDNRGFYNFTYNGRIEKKVLKKEMKDFMKSDAAIRSQVDLDKFEEKFDKVFSSQE